ncbi:hypothetical protein [Lentzea sp. NBRC 102530]|nr:hypothetical protein [Lentzea sp. NBRC 102530]GLY47067.1 hypothetical protein Lesp01_07230 [Lentzea sp. NBRC 102530]
MLVVAIEVDTGRDRWLDHRLTPVELAPRLLTRLRELDRTD